MSEVMKYRIVGWALFAAYVWQLTFHRVDNASIIVSVLCFSTASILDALSSSQGRVE